MCTYFYCAARTYDPGFISRKAEEKPNTKTEYALAYKGRSAATWKGSIKSLVTLALEFDETLQPRTF